MTDDATRLQQLIESAVTNGSLRHVVLSQPTQAGNDCPVRIDIRPVSLKTGDMLQWSRRAGNQVFHENCSSGDTMDRLLQMIGLEYRHVHLTTDDDHWAARYSRRGKCRIHREGKGPESSRASDHNRKRQYLIPDGRPVPFLVETGIMTPAGRVKAKHYHKFRQINRFVEFIDDVIEHLPLNEQLQIVDFGCGKSYLTFATHYYLAQIAKRDVSVVGLDRRRDVIATCCQIVDALGLTGIRFQHGDIADFTPEADVHLAISLHACDTATDDALAQALEWNSNVILSVPCCQHELNSLVRKSQIPLLTQFGILKERFCALATDGIRAALLEKVGYQTQVLEFIDMEHTAKNLLIRAVRRSSPSETPGTGPLPQQLDQFCGVFQLPPLHLQRTLEDRGILFSPSRPSIE